ncbi:hypothetical protein E5K00_18515 [Hymenobacter aquaticus]|uniref:Uncharacterized protein n=1 Tax=Hymenobacter aquaticus TaxID=1867101 RepID=A0A4Z0PZC0_9BACT|nr:hypothetical protein [Hymenobacter aquaticus]TGE22241.1 hypothetical protein E5K00_18515 [Hymenobacter aquaticus]
MRTTAFRPAFALVVVFLLLAASVEAVAGSPFVRAQQRGRRYVHRPIYKQYQPQAHKSRRVFAFLSR